MDFEAYICFSAAQGGTIKPEWFGAKRNDLDLLYSRAGLATVSQKLNQSINRLVNSKFKVVVKPKLWTFMKRG